VKFRSSLIRTGPFTAENAGQREDHHEDDIKILTLTVNYSLIYSLFFPSSSYVAFKERQFWVYADKT
jgi:hypothetical protein